MADDDATELGRITLIATLVAHNVISGNDKKEKMKQDIAFIETCDEMNCAKQAAIYVAYARRLRLEKEEKKAADRNYEADGHGNLIEPVMNVQEMLLCGHVMDLTNATAFFHDNELRRLLHQNKVIELAEAIKDARNPRNTTWHIVVEGLTQPSQFNGHQHITMNDVHVERNEEAPPNTPITITREIRKVPMGLCFGCARAGQLNSECPGCNNRKFVTCNFHDVRSLEEDQKGIIDAAETARFIRNTDDNPVIYPVFTKRNEQKNPLRWTKVKHESLHKFLLKAVNTGCWVPHTVEERERAAAAMKVSFGRFDKCYMKVTADKVRIRCNEDKDSDDKDPDRPDKNTIG